MKRFYAKRNGDEFILDDEEFSHFLVLRLKENDNVICFDGSNTDYICSINRINKKNAVLKIVEQRDNLANPRKQIDVFQCIPKGEKNDLITQKLTENGISNLFLFESQFTVAKQNDNKLDRLNKVTIEACKQCGRSIPLNIQYIKFIQVLELLKDYEQVIFANEKEEKKLLDLNLNKLNKIAIIIGSEGGFSDEEIHLLQKEKKLQSISLGKRILRTETASIVLSYMVSYLSDN